MGGACTKAPRFHTGDYSNELARSYPVDSVAFATYISRACNPLNVRHDLLSWLCQDWYYNIILSFLTQISSQEVWRKKITNVILYSMKTFQFHQSLFLRMNK